VEHRLARAPWFGGSAAVWTTCLVFFQSVLSRAMRTPTSPSPSARGARRCSTSGCSRYRSSSCRSSPRATGSRRATSSRSRASCCLLLATIGLPYFLLSTTTPLPAGVVLAPLPQPRALSPVRASNLASLLALVGFPLVFEPALDLKQLGLDVSFVSPASSSFARSPRGCR